jgi:hypothetical protein
MQVNNLDQEQKNSWSPHTLSIPFLSLLSINATKVGSKPLPSQSNSHSSIHLRDTDKDPCYVQTSILD